MTRLLYQILLWLSLPAVLIRLEWRARREPEYGKRIGERLGQAPATIPPGCIWFHAVSAGETIAVAPLIAQLAQEFSNDDGPPFLVTATTPAGSAQVSQRLGRAVHHCYAPYDFQFAVRAFFDRVRPRLLVLVETELWPNLIDEAHRRGVPVLLVNARLSRRSAGGYLRVRNLTRGMLRQIDAVACQYRDHLERFNALGLPRERGRALGNIKFDAVLPEDHAAQAAAFRQRLRLGRAPVWIAASTHPGEDEAVLGAHARVLERYPQSRLLLAPRHPVRADGIADLARQRGFATLRLSSAATDDAGDRLAQVGSTLADKSPRHSDRPARFADPSNASSSHRADSTATDARPAVAPPSGRGDEREHREPPQADQQHAHYSAPVVLCDTIGVLQTLYGLSDVAFLGGSLVPVGGHNPIEAALCSQPLVTGPHTFNFEEVFAAFAAEQCIAQVETPAQLADAVIAAFADEKARNAAGAQALRVVEANRGATERLLDLLRTTIHAVIT